MSDNDEQNPPLPANDPPATPPAASDPPAPGEGDDSGIDAIVEKVLEKIRSGFRPSSGAGGNSLRDVEEAARRAVADATAHLQKEKEQTDLIKELKEKVDKELAPLKYKGLAAWLFGRGEEKK